jgi:hypothetical protein
LNQRLCEIRNQSASAATMSLDLEFRHAYDINVSNFSEDEIDALRQEYARELTKDKRFVFGKYIAKDGKVCLHLLTLHYYSSPNVF